MSGLITGFCQGLARALRGAWSEYWRMHLELREFYKPIIKKGPTP